MLEFLWMNNLDFIVVLIVFILDLEDWNWIESFRQQKTISMKKYILIISEIHFLSKKISRLQNSDSTLCRDNKMQSEDVMIAGNTSVRNAIWRFKLCQRWILFGFLEKIKSKICVYSPSKTTSMQLTNCLCNTVHHSKMWLTNAPSMQMGIDQSELHACTLSMIWREELAQSPSVAAFAILQ